MEGPDGGGNGRSFLRRMNDKGLAICRDLSGTMGPERVHFGEPTGEFTAGKSVGRISTRPELVGETAGGEQGDSSGVVVRRPSFPD